MLYPDLTPPAATDMATLEALAKGQPINPKHSAKTVEHYTPKRYIEAVHQVLGNISLDPASNAIANETVGATRYYTKDDVT